MADDRTAGQREADEALSAAIERVILEYYPEMTSPRMIGDYMVIGEISEIEDGDSLVFSHPRNGQFPFYRQMGLIDYVHARHKAQVGEIEDDG